MSEIRNLTRNGETFYPLTHEKAVIGMEDFKDTITEQIDNYRPIEITGDVVNAPDEEDITSDSNNLLKFKNRNNLYGLGKVILRRSGTFASQVTQANTIYVIQYNFDLDSARINIPNGSILLFEGGTLSNGTLVCADLYDVRLVYYQDQSEILSGVTLEGNFIHKACDKDTIREILVDDSSITKDVNDVLSVKANGIQNTHLNSNTVDDNSIALNGNNKISIKDGGVTGNKLNSGIVNTDDLSIVNSKIQLANRGTTDGMGKIILRKDQSFASQLTQQNTIYVIQYDFTLGEDITIPTNCILEFDGGSISGNGTAILTGTHTGIIAGYYQIFGSTLNLGGIYDIDKFPAIWYGLIPDDRSVDFGERVTFILTQIVNIFPRHIWSSGYSRSGIDVFFIPGAYFSQTSVNLDSFGENLDNIGLVGASFGSVMVINTNQSIFTIDKQTTTMQGLRLIKNIIFREYYGALRLHGATNLLIEQCGFWGHTSRAVEFDVGAEITIRNCNFVNAEGIGIYFKVDENHTTTTYIENCWFQNCGTGIRSLATTSYGARVLVSNTTIEYCTIGIRLEDPNTDKYRNNFIFRRCHIEGNSKSEITGGFTLFEDCGFDMATSLNDKINIYNSGEKQRVIWKGEHQARFICQNNQAVKALAIYYTDTYAIDYAENYLFVKKRTLGTYDECFWKRFKIEFSSSNGDYYIGVVENNNQAQLSAYSEVVKIAGNITPTFQSNAIVLGSATSGEDVVTKIYALGPVW